MSAPRRKESPSTRSERLPPARARSPFRDRIVELRRVPASELEPHPKNWRRHPERQRAALRAMLREVGFADALIARQDASGTLVLIDGHLRKSLGPRSTVPVLVVDLDEEEADKLLAALDPLASLAEPDPDALGELLASISTEHQALEDLFARLARDAGIALGGLGADPEEAPPFPPEPVTHPGDLVVLGDHRIMCADSTDPGSLSRLMEGARADVLWTDPPYGVAYEGKTPRRLRIANDVGDGLDALLERAFAACDGVLRPGAALYVAHPAGPLSVCFGQRFLAQGWRLHQTLVWMKDAMVLGRSDYHYRHEPILYGYKPGPGRWGRGGKGWYGGNDQTSVFEVPRPTASREHPTAKPVELIRRHLQNSSKEKDVVLDPFLGSGSTLIACHELGRRCFGVELDPAYCDVAITRWESFTGRKAKRLRAEGVA